MSETLPKIYENFTEQERLEADANLVGFFGLLYKIDQRLKRVQANNLMKGGSNGKEPKTKNTRLS